MQAGQGVGGSDGAFPGSKCMWQVHLGSRTWSFSRSPDSMDAWGESAIHTLLGQNLNQ